MSSIYEIFCGLISEKQPVLSSNILKLRILQMRDMVIFETHNLEKIDDYVKKTQIEPDLMQTINVKLLNIRLNINRCNQKIGEYTRLLIKQENLTKVKEAAKSEQIKETKEQFSKYIITVKKRDILHQLTRSRSPNALKIIKEGKQITNTYAKCDMILEENCIYGDKCINLKNPLLCPLNHFNLGKMIKKNELIPYELCRYESPWIIINGIPSHCTNVKCYFSHLDKRKKYIDYIKQLI